MRLSRKSIHRVLFLVAPSLAFILLPRPAAAQDRYYLWVFSSQSEPKLPCYTHTWAALARLPDGCGPRPFVTFTLSWMPATLRIRTYALLPEPGVNLDLPTTLRFVWSEGERISVWGPYAVSACLYERAWRQKVRLESGEVRYRALDGVIRSDCISCCIHAVSDIAPGQTRLMYIEAAFFGEAAGRRIAHAFRRDGLTCPVAEDLRWLEQALGFYCYPIIRRD
jgi:hypothetical protein